MNEHWSQVGVFEFPLESSDYDPLRTLSFNEHWGMDAGLQLCYLSSNSSADTGSVCKPCDFPGEMWLQLGFFLSYSSRFCNTAYEGHRKLNKLFS